MAKLVKIKPTSPGRRFVIKTVRSHLHKGGPYAPLTKQHSKTGGRNNLGRITVRHRGGGHKRRYREVDFKRNNIGISGRVERIEYDPNRTGHLALVVYSNGAWRYILASDGLEVGHNVVSSVEAPIKPGNCLPLRNIPLGTVVHAIELKPGKGAQLARSAGASAKLLARESGYALLRLPSSEIRKVPEECMATIGLVGNPQHSLEQLGKAGATRWKSKRSKVRGVAMNPVDHRHGGGEGKTSGGGHPVSFSGVPAKGYKTRRNLRTDPLIVTRRKKK